MPLAHGADADALKAQGNAHFRRGQYGAAVSSYSAAIDLWMEPSDRAVLYTNRSAARLKLGEAQRALADAERAVQLCADYAKGHYRRAVALRSLGQTTDARAALQTVLELAPTDAAARAELDALSHGSPSGAPPVASAVASAAPAISASPPPPPPRLDSGSQGALDSTCADSDIEDEAAALARRRQQEAAEAAAALERKLDARRSAREVVWTLRDHDQPGRQSRVVALTKDQAAAEERAEQTRLFAQVAPGTRVMLMYLQSRSELNGKVGVVTGLPRSSDARIPVRVELSGPRGAEGVWVRRRNVDPNYERLYEGPPRCFTQPSQVASAPSTAATPSAAAMSVAGAPASDSLEVDGSRPLIEALVRALQGGAAEASLEERVGRGRCAIAMGRLPAGTTLPLFSGQPFAACPIPALRSRQCAACLRELRRHDAGTPCTCPHCAFPSYCSAACRAADSAQHARQCRHLVDESAPLRRLEAAAEGIALGRLGALLLASRCLWRRHDEAARQAAAMPIAPVTPMAPMAPTGRGRESAGGADAESASTGHTTPTGTATAAATADLDLFCFDTLLPGPTSDADDELGLLAQSLEGFLPLGATAANVTALLGSFRVNQFSILDDSSRTAVGAGCYPRAAMLNHSCAPNCVLTYDGASVQIRTLREVAAGEELTHSYVNLCCATSTRREKLRVGYGFECVCERCTAYPQLDAAMVVGEVGGDGDGATAEDGALRHAREQLARAASLERAGQRMPSQDMLWPGESGTIAGERTGERVGEYGGGRSVDVSAECGGMRQGAAAEESREQTLQWTLEALQVLRPRCPPESVVRYHAECDGLRRATAAGEDDVALACARGACAFLEAAVAHVPCHPLLALQRYRLAELEAEVGDGATVALALMERSVAALAVTHGPGHTLHEEAEMWCETLRELASEESAMV